jgi:hypothetical protein
LKASPALIDSTDNSHSTQTRCSGCVSSHQACVINQVRCDQSVIGMSSVIKAVMLVMGEFRSKRRSIKISTISAATPRSAIVAAPPYKMRRMMVLRCFQDGAQTLG